MIENIIFDFGKVLVDYDIPLFINRYLPLEGDEKEWFKSIFMSQQWIDRYDKEDIPFEETIALLKKTYPQYEWAIKIFDEHYHDIVTGEVPGMRSIMENLKNRGYKLYGLSNWNSRVRLTMAQYDIFKLLDDRLISSEVHLIKPSREIYIAFLERFNLDPATCIFTDDKPVNVEGAAKVGIDGIVFKDAAQFSAELETRLSSGR